MTAAINLFDRSQALLLTRSLLEALGIEPPAGNVFKLSAYTGPAPATRVSAAPAPTHDKEPKQADEKPKPKRQPRPLFKDYPSLNEAAELLDPNHVPHIDVEADEEPTERHFYEPLRPAVASGVPYRLRADP